MARGRPSMGGYPKTGVHHFSQLAQESGRPQLRYQASIPGFDTRQVSIARIAPEFGCFRKKGPSASHRSRLAGCSGIWLPFYGGYPKVVPVAGWRATALRNKPFWQHQLRGAYL